MDSNSASVWGRTLAATGGTLGLLVSGLVLAVTSGYLSLTEELYGVFFMTGPLLGVVGSFLPRISNKVRGGIMFGGVLIVLAFWGRVVSSNIPGFIGPGPLELSLVFVFSWTIMIGIGGVLTFRFRQNP